MAFFDYLSYEIYDRDGGGTSPHFSAESVETDEVNQITDGQADFNVAVGDTVFLPAGFVGTFTFQGIIETVDDMGAPITLVIVSDGVSGTNGNLYAFSPLPVANTVFPATINEDTAASNVGVSGQLLCFAKDMWIATPNGEKRVQDLSIGDMVLTAEGKPVPVKWLGRQTLMPQFGMAERNHMVEIAAGALGDGLPHSDLRVTADHGMIVDGLVVNAGAMVNNDTVRFVPLNELEARFTVYHIETENHDVILANGAPSETFIDYLGRQAFDNYAEYETLYGAGNNIVEMSLPRISSARLLPDHIRTRIGVTCEDETAELASHFG